MSKTGFSEKFIAEQVAGSCRLEGMRISANDEQLMLDIIAGKVNAAELRRQLVQQYRVQNRATLKAANA